MSLFSLFPKSNNRQLYSAGEINTQAIKSESNSSNDQVSILSKAKNSKQKIAEAKQAINMGFPKENLSIPNSDGELSEFIEQEEGVNITPYGGGAGGNGIPQTTPPAYTPVITDVRPEILSISQFKPLYVNSKTLSDEGKLFDSYVKALQFANANSIEAMTQILGQEKIKEKNAELKKQIEILRTNSQNLNQFIRKIAVAKKFFDILDESYYFRPFSFIEDNIEDSDLVDKDFLRTSILNNGKYSIRTALKTVRKVPENKLSAGNKVVEISPITKAVDSWSKTKLFLFSVEELRYLHEGFSLNAYSDIDGMNSQFENSEYDIQPFYSGDGRTNYVQEFKLVDTDTIDLQSAYFKFCNDVFNSVLKKDYAIPLSMYIPFKELNKKIRSQRANLTLDQAKTKYSSFLGTYPKVTKPIWSLSEVQPYTGDKLQDLAYFGAGTERILALETAKNSLNNSLKTLDSYMLFAGSTKTEEFFSELTFKTERIRDFKNFISNLFNLGYDSLIDLSGLPIKDDFIVSLNNGLSTTDPKKVLSELIKKIKSHDRGFNVDKINNKEVPHETMYNGTSDDNYSLEGKFSQFKSFFAQSIFAYEFKNSEAQWKFENALFSYMQYRMNGVVDPTTDRLICERIAKIIATYRNELSSTADFGPGSLYLKKGVSLSEFELANIIQWSFNADSSLFIVDMANYFKPYKQNLGDFFALFFFGFLKVFRYISNVKPRFYNWVQDLDNKPTFACSVTRKRPTSEQKTAIFTVANQNKIKEEQDSLSILTFSILNILSRMKIFASSLTETANSFDETVTQYFLRYLNNDKTALSKLFVEQQLSLLLTTIEDLYQSFEGFNSADVSNLQKQLFSITNESLYLSPAVVDSINQLFSSDSGFLQSKGYNKQIISIGFPQGLLRSMIQSKTSISSVSPKQNDIFRIKIYKMDLLNPFVIYKPKSFLFEASRYPVKVYSELKKIDIKKVEDITGLTTRNYSLFTDLKTAELGAFIKDYDLTNTFGKEYEFLKADVTGTSEAEEILMNHNMSFLLENYIKIMSGLSLNENTFISTDLSKTQNLLDSIIQDKQKTLKDSIANFPALRDFFAKFNPTVPASDAIISPDLYIQKLVQPKKFDRIFNIIFDPEFEVDLSGIDDVAVLPEQSVEKKFIEQAFSNADSSSFNKISENVYVDKDKTPDDISLNAYFVSVETYL